MRGTSTVGREQACLKHVSVYKEQARMEQVLSLRDKLAWIR
jgi:hypothetical protein